MRRVIIVQARMGSSRLPGKVLADVAGRPMLEQQVRRLQHCHSADDIVVATSSSANDDPIVPVAEKAGVRWFRGNEHDVLGRYRAAAAEAHADIVVRITADCPLIDPEITDLVIDRASSGAYDYTSNVLRRTYPKGLDVEAFPADVLIRVDRLATSKAAREHVTWFIHNERPDLFIASSIEDSSNFSHLRWTVDTAEDLEYVRRLYHQFGLSERTLNYADMCQKLEIPTKP